MIKADKHNANKGTSRGRGMVEQSLKETGAGRSILLDRDGNVIAGNKTLEAAQRLGLEVEIVRSDGTKLIAVQREDLDLDDPTGTAWRLAYYDNQASAIGLQWDPDTIKLDVQAGVNFDGVFTQAELEALLAELTQKTKGAGMGPDRAAELQQIYNVQPGQVWKLGRHRITCGDCTDPALVARLTANVKPTLCHADPPYGIDLIGKKTRHLGKSKGYRPVEGDDKPFDPAPIMNYAPVNLFWGANHYADKLPASPFWLVWDKQGGAKDIDHASCELAWCNLSKPARVITHVWDGFRRDSEQGIERYHPNQKPIEVIKWALSWIEAKLVLDLYSGSGTAILACEALGRQCLAVELVPDYVAVCMHRWAEETGGQPEIIYG